ncbi:MAG: hypothetical protein HYZ04_03815 [Rhodospirillales bacterium]|nr:hypothetical protein [Rhodospirillales bacterium]MBI2585852.1 hypothetical protein [Rhodospirillales bacterium]MBI2977606.1 hypothetical protein [Rhodospirillales bacterium]MBI3113626.1 hypothetical protein [Rhodospirillales bacterium]
MRTAAGEARRADRDAEPLKRVIQRALQNPLAGLILEDKVLDGDEVKVSAGADGLTINGEAIEAEAM